VTLTLLPECASATATALKLGVRLLVYKVTLSRDTEQSCYLMTLLRL
jgi:hypothetical protein